MWMLHGAGKRAIRGVLSVSKRTQAQRTLSQTFSSVPEDVQGSRKLHATLTRYLVSPGETINVIVADPNPETREPMAALIKALHLQAWLLGCRRPTLIVFQTANQDDIYGALHHAR